MNILVTGANGQLGSAIRIVSEGSSDSYIFTDIAQAEGQQTDYLDITDITAIKTIVRSRAINGIINCAAYTNVEAAETDKLTAEKINAVAPHNLSVVMKEVEGTLIHISTDYVFGRAIYNTPCNEELKASPIGVYGESKLHGEQNIIASGCKYIIIRTAWLYSEFGKNFCKTILNLTATKPQINVVFDQIGTPTYALDLAKTIVNIIDSRKFEQNIGIYHYSNEGVCSWYDFAKAIAEYSGHTSCNIKPCHSSDFPSNVARPAFSVLDKTKIKNTFGIDIPHWTTSLRKCIPNM